MKAKSKPYRIIGAYDSETTNIETNGIKAAFPILHQLGLIHEDVADLADVTPDNVESLVDVRYFRHAFELYSALDAIAYSERDYVPVILCHNLAFDMYGLAEWLNAHNVRVLAKSKRKPITFTICDDDNQPLMVIWDTLVFAQKPLSMMGHECGYEKLTGYWDYDLIRSPETPLSENELAYASHDIYALIAWFGYWLRMNPDIAQEKLGLNIVTKTGVIRARRIQRFDGVKGKGSKYNVGRFWHYLNNRQLPKTDDELFTMHAATRGGFTFCSSRWANVPISDGLQVLGYDATSQHPAQMVSHVYPVDFHESTSANLDMAFSIVAGKSATQILSRFDRPFLVAFYGLFEFENLRPRKGSLFEREGIYPLASARFSARTIDNDDNQASDIFNDDIYARGYRDTASNPKFLFGKLVSADKARLFITELTAWEIAQAYEFDSVHAIGGYITQRFEKPSDMAVISVMQFYDAKNVFKHAMREYGASKTISEATACELQRVNIAQPIIEDMRCGMLPADDLQFVYLGLKADLNGLFGIEATNEYRCDTVLDADGIGYAGDNGICNAPKNPKAWYQFGQRIVGWSRIAQMIVMQLCYPHCIGIANGDTDSVKFVIPSGYDRDNIDGSLSAYASAIDKAKTKVCARVCRFYPELFSELEYIGHYVHEFTADNFCCAWNKAYCIMEDGKFEFTLAGIPTSSSRRAIDFNRCADMMHADGMRFEDICRQLLGFNLTISNDITGLNARLLPPWADCYVSNITDYLGNVSNVAEPRALALFPLAKTINSTDIEANRANMRVSLANDPLIETKPRTLYFHNGRYRIIYNSEMRAHG